MTTGSEYPGGYEGASPRVPEPSPEKRGIGEFSDSRDRPVGGQTFEMRSDAIFVQHPVGSPSRRVLCFLFVLLAAGPVPFAGRATAENDGNRRPGAGLDARQRQIVSSIETTLRQAGTEFRSGQYEESGDSVRRALRQIDAAANVITPQLHEALGPILDRIETAHVLLELEGVSLPPFRRPPVPASRAGFVATAPGRAVPMPPTRTRWGPTLPRTNRWTETADRAKTAKRAKMSKRVRPSLARRSVSSRGSPRSWPSVAANVICGRPGETFRSVPMRI